METSANVDTRESLFKSLERRRRELDEREKQMFAKQQEHFELMHTLHAEMDKRNKDRRRSRGVCIDTDENMNREEKSHYTPAATLREYKE